MDRREWSSMLGAGATGQLAKGGGTAFADHEHDDQIGSIGECVEVYKLGAHHGLGECEESGPHAEHLDPGG